MIFPVRYPLAALAVVMLVGLVLPAEAQGPPPGEGVSGRVRVQGRDVTPGEAAVAPTAPTAALIDYPEEMRRFIQNLSVYARKTRKDFAVIPVGGLELLTKPDPQDETKRLPAQAYLKSIDALMVEGLHFAAQPEFGQPPEPPERQAWMLERLETAKRYRLKVLALDYARDSKTVDEAYRQSAVQGFVPFVAAAEGADINALPPHPRRPFRENGNHVLSLADVRNFAIIRNSAAFGRQDEFAIKLHETNYDMLVVDVFHGREALTRQAVETLKYKKLGARRLVLAYLNIGTAESYRFYWQPDWKEGSPIWISAPYPGNPDKYFVQFWRPEWQKIVFGDVKSYVYGIIDLGFDGVILDGLESHRYFDVGLDQMDALAP